MEHIEELLAGIRLPPTMQVTQILLKQWQQETEILEQQWLHAKTKRASLAKKLRTYALQQRQSMILAAQKRANRQTSLGNLPDELLCTIFDYATYLVHPSIRSLMLVCKRFHQIIMGTSTLWTRIDLMFPEDLMGPHFPTQCYIQACLERSKERLLDITIKLPCKLDPTTYQIDQIEKIVEPKFGRTVAGYVAEALYESEWQTDDGPVQERASCVHRLIELLLGVDQKQMMRWESLKITLPQEIYGPTTFFDNLGGPTPNLRRLEIHNLEYADTYLIDEPPFHDLSGLRMMTVDYLPSYIVEIPGLTHLDTEYRNGCMFSQLGAFKQLQHLYVRHATDKSDFKGSVTLPYLSTLHIHGTCDQVLTILKVPHLERLHISSAQTSLKRPLPFVP
ncbi:SubName: Full=Uncharacterized protein {ECO:0000313/EMBL:CCA71908.1} [Serendipita indica DSM 11827]|nr:SubName: Full=Uncharacterized protein {ECO:0000313/EMBL:CCA71908.1} [Serendipita indica DSM 11827]